MREARLPVDRLRDGAGPVEVRRLELMGLGPAAPVREPHRHDYHELVWIERGRGTHLLDGEEVAFGAGSLTLIGRGQVHVLLEAEDAVGAVVRVLDELLVGAPGWLLAGCGGTAVVVPAGERARLGAAIDAIAAETARPPDARSSDLLRHLLAVVLLWVERWYDEARTERRDARDAEVELHRRFAAVLEQDWARHHDAAHYAERLGVPQAALSRALVRATGRSTKELVLDRVLLEAARLVRFTDLTVQQVAQRTGYRDAFALSRAFKRRFGESPVAYRARARGNAMHA
ncbi:MAG: AraC family transcriptional regulator [Thermoleophilia bacterium]